MKRDFAFASLNLNIIIQKKNGPEKVHVLCIMLVKTRGVRYFNVETWMLFAPTPIKISGCAPDWQNMFSSHDAIFPRC